MVGRRSSSQSVDFTDNSSSTGATVTETGSEVKANVQRNDVLMDAATGTRVIVTAGGSTDSLSGANVTLKRLDGANFASWRLEQRW